MPIAGQVLEQFEQPGGSDQERPVGDQSVWVCKPEQQPSRRKSSEPFELSIVADNRPKLQGRKGCEHDEQKHEPSGNNKKFGDKLTLNSGSTTR